jgi:uncharacterized NAD-dependent epimerase/dehydratase family protein
VLVEGQGAIFHPAYAPVTFGLLYGSAPDVLVLCHRPGTVEIHGYGTRIPDLPANIRAHEDLLRRLKPAAVAAIVLDTSALDDAQAAAVIAETARSTGLPADDPVRNGAARLWSAIAAALRTTPKARRRERAAAPAADGNAEG